MTTRRRRRLTIEQRQRLLFAEISREVAANPEISARQVAVKVRGRGFKGSNTLIRDLVRFRKAGGEGILEAARAIPRGLSEANEARRLFDVIQAIQGRKVSKRVEAQVASIKVTWQVTVTVRFSEFNGRKVTIDTFTAIGGFVQRARDYDAGLVGERINQSIEQRLDGQIAQFINAGGDADKRRNAASYLEGINFEIINQSAPRITVTR